MSEAVFVDGMRFEKPSEKAPDFIRGRLSVNVKQFTEWAEKHQNERGWLNIDLKRSQKGVLYLQLNTYKKTADLDDVGEIAPEDSPF